MLHHHSMRPKTTKHDYHRLTFHWCHHPHEVVRLPTRSFPTRPITILFTYYRERYPIFNPSLIISHIVLYSKNRKLNRIGFVGLELESVPHPSAVAVSLNSGGRNDDEMKERQRWQPEEDALLRAYVKEYVEPRLSVDGEAPLPWPEVLPGAMEELRGVGPEEGMTSKEQALVVSLQAKHGNKCKKIVAKLPGHTPKRLGKLWRYLRKNISSCSLRGKRTNIFCSVSQTLSPSDSDPDPTCFHQMGILIQLCKEVDEGRQSWMQQKNEAMWRLSRLKQQLESVKGRKRREVMEKSRQI